ncbi:MAG: HAMP domain-containing histidine kinase [Acidobacteria bacterium]|nr:HAMP domain-containing histidine kinase [Acidobacteriota bacterium]MCW5971490.1 HAMP domain-containing histidine kinase [Blastocatellales bacterium]
MWLNTRRKSVVFFTVFGICLVALAVALNIGWILLNWREVALLVLGIVFFPFIIAGLVLNTIFLVREIRRNEQHDSFINAVTHELKTPIASIRLYLETLQTREVPPERRREFYRVMLEDADRLLHTVEQVLRAGRSGDRRRQIDHTDLDFGELVNECIKLARTRTHLDQSSIKYTEFLDDHSRPIIRGDQDELRAAVSNLIDNAIKYSVQEIDIGVELDARNPKYLALRVRDKGAGIPPDQLKRIFGRFHRVPLRVTARVKGAGLGLFIVSAIVKKHGGRVFAESEGEGLGSTFTIELPRAASERNGSN